ncbi:uncharacterized protein [Dermacentor andersoni]|uniref:uncharacterized protein isoform X2 n=1 Tax=Dermacentor andersoni TaxID=34620 RepID=UPI003B3BDF92
MARTSLAIHMSLKAGITSSPPVASSTGINHAQPTTSHASIEEGLVIPENIARISDDASRYQGNMQHMPMTDGTCNVDGMLLEPEAGKSESCAVSAATFRANGMAYTGTPRKSQMTQPTFSKHVSSHL